MTVEEELMERKKKLEKELAEVTSELREIIYKDEKELMKIHHKK